MSPLYENDHFTIHGPSSPFKANLTINAEGVTCTHFYSCATCKLDNICRSGTRLRTKDLSTSNFIHIIAPGFLDQYPELLL